MSIDRLSLTFAAIADPTRRAILLRLSQGEAPVKELAEPFEMTLPAITKHLKVLERAGLIERTRSAQMRPCRLRTEPLQEAASWIDRYRLGTYLDELQSQADSESPPTSQEKQSQ